MAQIPRNITLNQNEYDIVLAVMKRLGLGERGFSVALRIIINQWQEQQAKEEDQPQPKEEDKV